MLRHLGAIAVSACIVATVGCDGGPTNPGPIPKDTVEFSGRVINGDTEAPVGDVRVSVERYFIQLGDSVGGAGPVPTNTATSTGDGTFILPLTLQAAWTEVLFKVSGPGYHERFWRFERSTTGTRAEIVMYPWLVITPGASIEVRLIDGQVSCGWDACRRVLVAAPSDESVGLEVVSHDSSKPIALWLAVPGDSILEHDLSVSRLIVPPGGVPHVIGAGTGTLTAHR